MDALELECDKWGFDCGRCVRRGSAGGWAAGLSLCLGPVHVGAGRGARGGRGGVDAWWRGAAPARGCEGGWGPARGRWLVALARVTGAGGTVAPLVLARVGRGGRIGDSGSRRARIPDFEISELQKRPVFQLFERGRVSGFRICMETAFRGVSLLKHPRPKLSDGVTRGQVSALVDVEHFNCGMPEVGIPWTEREG